jgi:hypothetical protein
MFFGKPSELAKVIALRIDMLKDAQFVGVLGDALQIDERTSVGVDMSYCVTLYVQATETRASAIASLHSKADIRHIKAAVYRLYGRVLSGEK